MGKQILCGSMRCCDSGHQGSMVVMGTEDTNIITNYKCYIGQRQLLKVVHLPF